MSVLLVLLVLLHTVIAEKCHVNCRRSSSRGNSCCTCEHGSFREICQVDCLTNFAKCLLCLNFHRARYRSFYSKCLGCHEYENLCNGECKNCPDECVSCFDNKFCYECKSGLYGNKCNRKCGNCKPDNHGVVKCNIDNGRCPNKCTDGYYGLSCNLVCGHCLPDNFNVVKCNLYNGCCAKGCDDNYFGPLCDKTCENCLPDDNGTVKCGINTGNCFNNCIAGFFGQTCYHKCSSNCFDSNTKANKCEKFSGNCTYGCASGWYGDACNETCSYTCSERSCSQTTGDCDFGCVQGWYGDRCGESCSNTCYNISCIQKTGYCENGCVSGWYGDKCEFSCLDTCKGSVCDRETSQCLQGCVYGYEGAFCNMTVDHDSVLVGFTGSLAGAIISLVFVMSLLFIRRIIPRGKCGSNPRMSARQNLAPIYDELSDTNGTTLEQRVTVSHIYTEVGTAHTPRSADGSVSSTSNCCDNEIPGNGTIITLGVGTVDETMNDLPLICVSESNMSTLHSEVNKHTYSNGDVSPIHTLISPGIHRESSNETSKYHEISDIAVYMNLNTENHTSNGYEIPTSDASTSGRNVELPEADNTKLSRKCNGIATNSKSKSKKTHNKVLKPTTNREIDARECKFKQEVNTSVIYETHTNIAINKRNSIDVREHIENNQIQQKRGEGKCSRNHLESDFDIHLQKPETQNKAIDGDSESVNYIHPVI